MARAAKYGSRHAFKASGMVPETGRSSASPQGGCARKGWGSLGAFLVRTWSSRALLPRQADTLCELCAAYWEEAYRR